jgi:hypothetical protein
MRIKTLSSVSAFILEPPRSIGDIAMMRFFVLLVKALGKNLFYRCVGIKYLTPRSGFDMITSNTKGVNQCAREPANAAITQTYLE